MTTSNVSNTSVMESGSARLQQALVREIRGLGDAAMGSSSNTVNITSDRPVNDASRMLVEMQRLRAMRRR